MQQTAPVPVFDFGTGAAVSRGHLEGNHGPKLQDPRTVRRRCHLAERRAGGAERGARRVIRVRVPNRMIQNVQGRHPQAQLPFFRYRNTLFDRRIDVPVVPAVEKEVIAKGPRSRSEEEGRIGLAFGTDHGGRQPVPVRASRNLADAHGVLDLGFGYARSQNNAADIWQFWAILAMT